MVDMSPDAITPRLRLMDELWELSVALMNAKNASRSESGSEEGDPKESQQQRSEPGAIATGDVG
jgi:hypothetical protein